MEFTIKQVSEITKLSASTLRYYEKEQLIPTIKKSNSGHRIYDEKDLESISIITCLKDTDMTIQDIKKFISLCAIGDTALNERREIILAHRKTVLMRIDKLQQHMNHINYKVDYYNEACRLGTETELKKLKYPEHIHTIKK